MEQHPIPTVHELMVFQYEGELVYPQEVVQETLGLFSTQEKTEAFLRQWLLEHEASEARVSDPSQKATRLSFEIREIRLDVEADQALLFSRVYDHSGNLIGCENERENEPFFGRRPEECRFKEGELVQFVYNGRLQIGMVRDLPPTPEEIEEQNRFWRAHPLEYKSKSGRIKKLIPFADQSDDTYTVLYDMDDFSHDHVPEHRLSRPEGPVDNTVKERLGERYRYDKGVFIVFGKEETGLEYGIELNDYLVAEIPEPHVIVYDYYAHLVISMESFRVLKGDLQELDEDKVARAIRFIQENLDLLREQFREMLKQCYTDRGSNGHGAKDSARRK